MRAPFTDLRRRLMLTSAALCLLAAHSSAEEEEERKGLIGPVVKAVAEGDVARAAVLARKLVDSGAAGHREAAELRMLLAENRAALVGRLADADAEVRASCVWALGWIRDWESAAEAAKLLADDEARVRLEAARALGGFGESRFAENLGRASVDVDADVRRAALRSLAALGEGFEAGVRALSDESDEVRYAAARLLGEVPAADPELKKRAARALGEALEAARGGPRWDVRFAAAVALGRLGAKDGVPALVRAAGDAEERVGLTALVALGDVGGDEAARALVEIAQAGGPLARGAVEALGRTGVRSREVTGALGRIVREAPIEVARTAADALAALGGGAAKQALVEASRSGRRELRGPVAVAAARLDEYRPAAALLRDLDDEDEWTALTAARSLAEIGNPAGFPVFIHSLGSADERVRAFAATCLALYSGARMDVWTDGPESERKKVARAWRRWWLRNRSTFEVRRVERVGEGRPR